jgi:uncharacterized protein
MMPVVFDATALLQAAANKKGPAGACLAFVDEGRVKLLLSEATFEEIRDLLHRPAIRGAFITLTDERVSAFLDHLADKGHKIGDVPEVYRLDRDPKDAPYLNLAIATQARFIVTRDKDLLDLMMEEAFRGDHPSLTIIDPVGFLRHVRVEVAKELGYE